MCGMVILLQVVKVCDFGVARLKPTSLNAAEKSNCFAAEMTAETGTYRWMSPEVQSQQYSSIMCI
jgi:serine/threonine protein kinase